MPQTTAWRWTADGLVQCEVKSIAEHMVDTGLGRAARLTSSLESTILRSEEEAIARARAVVDGELGTLARMERRLAQQKAVALAALAELQSRGIEPTRSWLGDGGADEALKAQSEHERVSSAQLVSARVAHLLKTTGFHVEPQPPSKRGCRLVLWLPHLSFRRALSATKDAKRGALDVLDIAAGGDA